MTEGSFAQFVPEPVIKQINVREKKWEKQNKTVEELEVIHGNTVWAVLRSGVNTPVNPKDRLATEKVPSEVVCDDSMARRMILGGELKGQVAQNNQFDFNFRSGVELSTVNVGQGSSQSTLDNRFAYRNTDSQGHRPVPGITGFTVKTKDTWGMIMEANIQIKCWSRDDLELLDLVYFKPGFPALFEWGHTLYFDEDGNVCKNPAPIVTNALFFDKSSYLDYRLLDEYIYRGRQQNCNREAVFGYITNFSWSLNADGSYDCSLKILSKGAVLSGLTVKTVGDVDNAGDQQEDARWWEISPYHGILKAFSIRFESKPGEPVAERHPITGLDEGEDIFVGLCRMPGQSAWTESEYVFSGKKAIENSNISIKLPDPSSRKNQVDNLELVDFPVAVVPATRGKKHKGIELYYITLRSLLHIINVLQGDGPVECYYNTLSTQKFGDSGELHESLNPFVAIKPVQCSTANWTIDNPDLQQTKTASGYQTQCTDLDQILNIWVDYNAFVNIVESAIAYNPGGKYEINSILSEFLATIQKSFGNVNLFGSHYDHSTSYYEVVDRTMVRPSDSIVKNIPRLNVTGLKNTVVDLQVKSDITDDIVNTMCISAAAPAPKAEGADHANSETVFWGENCQPRWCMPTPALDPKKAKEQVKQCKKDKEKWEKKIKKFYEKLQKGKFKGNTGKESKNSTDQSGKKVKGDNNKNDYETLSNGAEEDLLTFQVNGERYWKNDDLELVKSGGYLHMGLIPYKMTLTLLGTSRLFIGNTFMLEKNNIIPRKYDSWGYLITGINHKVKNNQWFTELTTNYFPVFPDKQVSNDSPAHSDGSGFGASGGSVSALTDQDKPKRGPSEELADDCDYRVAYTQHSGIDYPSGTEYGGMCARYTYNWARTYVKGKEAVSHGAVKRNGHYEPAYSAGGNANQEGYWSNLEALGYTRGREVTLSGTDLARLKGGETVDGVTIKEGDVLVYGNDNHEYGHTCFYDGDRWCSDTDQKTANCYSDGPFSVRLFSSPPKNKDWQCGTHGKEEKSQPFNSNSSFNYWGWSPNRN